MTMSMIHLNVIGIHVVMSLLCTAILSSMKMEKFRRLGSFSNVKEALEYLGPNREMQNTQYVAECADMCVTNSCQVFLYHRSASLCLLSSREFQNHSSSHGINFQKQRDFYHLYQRYVKKATEYPDEIVSLGMESREIPDAAITVSDEFVFNKMTKNNSRIGARGGWSTPRISGSTNHNYWISIALNGPAIIYKVATAGCTYCVPRWVEQYSVQYSDDNIHWITYKENGTKKIFNGNTNITSGIVYQNFTPPIATTHLKLYTERLSVVDVDGVLSANGALRMDLYGRYLL